MDPRKLFADDRYSGMCVYCGGEHDTDDHVPSKVLLDEPFPDNLPLVPACQTCNVGFSADEPYLACLIECIIVGSIDPARMKREKVRRILTSRPHFGAEVSAGRTQEGERIIWHPDRRRVNNVILKLARGHAAYELAAPMLDDPVSIATMPLHDLTEEQRRAFETVPEESVTGWPEIGSRAFPRTMVVGEEAFLDNDWQDVQPGSYRYLVMEAPTTVRMVLSEYLACVVVWD